MRTAARIAATPLVLLITVAAGAGWLELLRRSGAFAAGPRITGALPLDRLARHDAQPLLRVLAAWVPAGLACGAALYALTGWSRPVRGALVGLGAFAIVFVGGRARRRGDGVGPARLARLRAVAPPGDVARAGAARRLRRHARPFEAVTSAAGRGAGCQPLGSTRTRSGLT